MGNINNCDSDYFYGKNQHDLPPHLLSLKIRRGLFCVWMGRSKIQYPKDDITVSEFLAKHNCHEDKHYKESAYLELEDGTVISVNHSNLLDYYKKHNTIF